MHHRFRSISCMLFVLLIFAFSAQAEPNQPRDFSYGIKIQNEDALTGVYSMASTYQILTSQKIVHFGQTSLQTPLTFFYASGEGFIKDRRVAVGAIAGLQPEVVKSITQHETNTDVCYVQNYVFGDGGRMTMGVHNDLSGDVEQIYQCFTAALWFYVHGEVEALNVSDWKNSLMLLLGNKRRVQ